MAKMQSAYKESIAQMSRKILDFGEKTDAIAAEIVYAGAGVLADEVRRNLQNLPEENFRYLQNGEVFDGVPKTQKQDLLDSLGITPVEQDKQQNYNAKVGFDGYGTISTKKYPKGLPNNMVARSIESGSSVRKKHPFIRPAIRSSKAKVIAAMQKKLEEKAKALNI